MTGRPRARLVATLALWALVGACASAPERDPSRDLTDEELHPLMDEPVVWDGRSGEPLTAAAVRERLAAVDVVLVGEQHGEVGSHLCQLQVARVAHEVGFDVVGVEWMPWHRRAEVEALWGLPPERSLPRVYHELDWPTTWGHDFHAYAPLLGWILERLQVVPLNARRELSRAVARGGKEAVPEELRAELPPLDSGSDAHRAWFAEVMGAHGGHGGHAMPAEALARYYLAQLVWDETMAMHTRALAATAPQGKVLVFAGSGHVERGLGIAARLGELRALIVLPVADHAEAQARAIDAAMPERSADLLWAHPVLQARKTNTASR